MREDKVLLVTGGSSDIGTVLIGNVAGNYSHIWAQYRGSKEPLDRMREKLGDKLEPIYADFESEESTRQMTERIMSSGKCPDHIVHLPSAKMSYQKFHKGVWRGYQEGIDIALRSAVLLLGEFIPHMVKQKYGRIIFMLTSSVLGIPPKYQAPYVTVKYALLGLMKSLSAEYAEKGIMVNAVSPDMVMTRFLGSIPEIIVRQNAEHSPLGRNLSVEDTITAFEFLLSDGAGTITGQNIGVTGGQR